MMNTPDGIHFLRDKMDQINETLKDGFGNNPIAPSRFPNGMMLEIDATCFDRELTEEERVAIEDAGMIIIARNGIKANYVKTCPNEVLIKYAMLSIQDNLGEGQTFDTLGGFFLQDISWAKGGDDIILNSLEGVCVYGYEENGDYKTKLLSLSL